MSQNGQTHFKNFAAFVARFLKFDHFVTLCIKGLRLKGNPNASTILSITIETWILRLISSLVVHIILSSTLHLPVVVMAEHCS